MLSQYLQTVPQLCPSVVGRGRGEGGGGRREKKTEEKVVILGVTLTTGMLLCCEECNYKVATQLIQSLGY